MNDGAQDELWPHFAPLWAELRAVAPGLLLAGGYGLFLKQRWLVSQLPSIGAGDRARILVPMHRWNDQTPR